MKTQWITHNGKKILFSDYSNIKSQTEMIQVLHESLEIVLKTSGKTLTLTDMTNCISGPDFMKEVKEISKKHAHKNEKSAMLGITGLKKMLLKGYNLFTDNGAKAFSTKEEALDYLTS